MDTEPELHRVVAGILRRADAVLLVHRHPKRRWYPNCWDLPGGHVEPGETAETALERELLEELGVAVVLGAGPIATFDAADHQLRIWPVAAFDGEPENRAPAEHDAIAWVRQSDLETLTLAGEALRPLLQAELS